MSRGDKNYFTANILRVKKTSTYNQFPDTFSHYGIGNHSLNPHITDTPLYEGNIQSKLKISFQARKSLFVK